MSKRVLGLDIGIASCGFALIDTDLNQIECLGVHCFEKAENPKTKESLAKPRRDKRLLRRVIRRRAQRIRHIQKLLIDNAIIEKSDLEKIALLVAPWDLRAELTERKLSNLEFAKVLLHIAKRRGFRSSKKESTKAKEDSGDLGKLLSGTTELEKQFKESGCKTIGQYLSSFKKKRNSNGEYTRTVLRKLHEEEIDFIFNKQRSLGLNFATEELKESYKKIAFYQRPLRSTADMVGLCTFEFASEEKRAPKHSYTSEKYALLQKLNNLRLIDEAGREWKLDIKEREKLIDRVYETSKLTFKQIKKELDVKPGTTFNFVRVDKDSTLEKEENKTFFEAKGYHKLKKVISEVSENYWLELRENFELLDKIAEIVTVEQDEEKIEKLLIDLGLPSEVADAVTGKVDFSGHLSLSFKAMKKLIPHLEHGYTYDRALEIAGYALNPREGFDKLTFVPKFEDLRNPVVNRALSQTRKVINAVIRKHGMPDRVHIELARDLGKSAKERGKIESAQKKNLKYKEEAKEHLKEILGREPTGDEVYRHGLWKEQRQVCVYSNKNIPVELLGDGTALEIDHAIPYSRMPSDSWNNKVLVYSDENRKKGNKTPFEYFGHDEERWNQFLLAIDHISFPKKRNISRKDFDDEKSKEWIERNLNDTRYIARELANHLKANLLFPNPDPNKLNVRVRNGQLTAHLRWQWGLLKNREEDDRHHALDAAVVACADERIAQRISHHSKNIETSIYKSKEKLELPWETFRVDLLDSIKNVFVSRLPRRKYSGQAHEDTIRSLRELPDGTKKVVQRVKLESVKLKDLENLWDKKRNIKLYQVLKDRLIEFADDPKKAFKDPVYMPAKNGRGPEIKSVVVETTEKSGVFVGGAGKKGKGFAKNGDMIRVDVFTKGGKFFSCADICGGFGEERAAK